jgi:hypothetical protein
LPLCQVNPGQHVLDVQTKLITHAIRVHTGYASANYIAHALVLQASPGAATSTQATVS